MFSVEFLNDGVFFVNHRDHLGRSLLHTAVQKKSATLVKEFIQIGCDVNAQNIRGETPILCADFSNSKIIEYLLEAGAHVNIFDIWGNSPLHLAILAHSPKIFCLESIQLLLHSAVDINKRNNDNETALDCAVRSKFIDIVEALLQKGAEVNREDCEKSVLTLAAIARDAKLFKLLLDNGANVDFTNQDGSSPLNLLYWLKDRETISAVINRTTNINRLDKYGYALLHDAVRKGNVILVETLLEGGADVSVMTRDFHCTALHEVIYGSPQHRQKIVKILLAKGARTNIQDIFFITPLLSALSRCDIAIVKLFAYYGADFTATDYKGDSALHWAAENSCEEVVKFVLDKGFNVNIKNRIGETALHIVVKTGTPEVCNILLDRGADIWCKDDDGKSSLAMYVDERDMYQAGQGPEPSELAALSLVAHITKLESLNFVIDQDDRKLLEVDAQLREQYETCKNEIAKMKQKKVYNTLTVYDILFASKDKISALVRNDDLVKAMYELVPNLIKNLSIYLPPMLITFRNEVQKQTLVKIARKVISDILKLDDPSHLVCEIIVSFFDEEDLERLKDY